jgi:hypothetical protein
MTVSSKNVRKVVTIGTIGSSPALLCSRLVSDMVHNGIDDNDDDRPKKTDQPVRWHTYVQTTNERAQCNTYIHISSRADTVRHNKNAIALYNRLAVQSCPFCCAMDGAVFCFP